MKTGLKFISAFLFVATGYLAYKFVKLPSVPDRLLLNEQSFNEVINQGIRKHVVYSKDGLFADGRLSQKPSIMESISLAEDIDVKYSAYLQILGKLHRDVYTLDSVTKDVILVSNIIAE